MKQTDEQMIEEWQLADSVSSFCERTGLSRDRAHRWALQMRKGDGLVTVALKKHPYHPPKDWQKLKAIAEKFA